MSQLYEIDYYNKFDKVDRNKILNKYDKLINIC